MSTRRNAGFTLVEIMVGMVIALIGMIVIFQVFAIEENVNRTTSSGSDAQQNGVYSLAMLQQSARKAGWGFNTSRAMGCNVIAYNAATGAFNYTLAPVVITAGPATGSDTLEINAGSANLLVAPTNLFQNQANSLDNFVVANRYGINAGDVILAAETGKSCTLAQATAVPTNVTNLILRDATNSAFPYNNPAGSGVIYTINGLVFNLGPTPTRDVFRVTNNQFTVLPSLSTNTAQVIADNIVQVRAQYGKDNGANNGTVATGPYVADDGIVDSYDNTTPATAVAWGEVLTVRVALVARSAQPEKPTGGSNTCNTTTAAPTWSGGTFNLTANANWMCYRYKVFETVIPIKNAIWSQG
jgi:type IV pilus assembly protein PilW